MGAITEISTARIKLDLFIFGTMADNEKYYKVQVNQNIVFEDFKISVNAFDIQIKNKENGEYTLERRFLKKVKAEDDSSILWFQPFMKLTVFPPLTNFSIYKETTHEEEIKNETAKHGESYKNCDILLEEELEYCRKSGPWRMSKVNREYEVCSTLGRSWIVPESISDTLLIHAARFRARGRLPILSYSSPINTKCTLIRSSQPLCGLGYRRSVQDEKLVKEFCLLGELVIVDARSLASALANGVTGKGGTELESFYCATQKIYLGLENIHAVRRAEYKLALEDEPEAWLGLLNNLVGSVWRLWNIINSAASKVCLLVHCSDGWDRTAQVVSLLSILLDTRYRTRRGLAMLVEKEWLAAGFQFTKRNLLPFSGSDSITIDGLAIINSGEDEECGQVWGQFLNVLWCWSRCCPELFEYGEQELLSLWKESQLGGVLTGDYENDPLRKSRTLFWKSFIGSSSSTFTSSNSKDNIEILQTATMGPFLAYDLNGFHTSKTIDPYPLKY